MLLGAELPQSPALADDAFVRSGLVVGAGNQARRRADIFGPILTVIPFDTAEEAVAGANDSAFGLVAGVHTTNIDKALGISEKLRVGQAWINSATTSNSRSAVTSFPASDARRGWRHWPPISRSRTSRSIIRCRDNRPSAIPK